jgi:hypothetical protein
MKNCNLRSVSVLLTAAILVAAFGGATAHAQYYGTQTSGARSPAASQQPTVIQIHHHHYYQPTGPTPIIAQQDDPGYLTGPGYLGGPPSVSMEPMPWERNYGELGFHGYLAQKGQYSGLIVSKVFPDTPASQLGLIVGDVIISVNDQVVNDLSSRQLEILFLGLTTQEKQAVNMDVWNSHTRRMSTLKAVFEDKEVKQFQDDALDDE